MTDSPTLSDVSDWWQTSVSRIEPNVIELRGTPIGDLLGTAPFTSVIWLMLRGDLPSAEQRALLDAALVAGVDHGPHAPSVAIARMAITCGIGLNNAIASGVNALGDVHGGAGEQCVELLSEIVTAQDGGAALAIATRDAVDRWRQRSKYLPGFGHRFHSRDPRRDPLLALVDRAAERGVVSGRYAAACRCVETELNAGRQRPVPMNVDGATAVIFAELGFAAPLARGLFVISRSVGLLAHAWEESGQGRRNKGPIPPAVRPTFG
jgi:citrate synthase